MNIVSACCHREVIHGTKPEYPLGRRFPIFEKVDLCECCGNETEPVNACDCCGIPSDKLTGVRLGDWCPVCIAEHPELVTA